jgi:hypothetical protein
MNKESTLAEAKKRAEAETERKEARMAQRKSVILKVSVHLQQSS